MTVICFAVQLTETKIISFRGFKTYSDFENLHIVFSLSLSPLSLPENLIKSQTKAKVFSQHQKTI